MSRKRFAFGAAAVLLIGASVFGGALSASAGPVDAPVITLPVTGPDPDGQPFVQGDVTEDGLTVTVEVTNSSGTSVYCVDPGATIVGGFGCVSGVPLPFGDNTFTATATYTSGTPDALPSPTSAPVVYTRWDPTGHVEILTGPAPVDTDPSVVFTGTGPALGHIALYEALVFGDEICATDVLADGTWQCGLPFLNPGNYQISIFTGFTTYFDGSGPVPDDTAAPFNFTVIVPPPASVDQTFSPWVTSGVPTTIQGNKDSTATYIQVYRGPTAAGPWTPYCQTSGPIVGATIWSCDPAFGTLAPGTNYISALAFYPGTSADFGAAAIIDVVAAPIIDAPADNLFTNDSTPTFSGTSVSGTNADVYSGGALCSAPIVAGAFACDAAPALADGTYVYFADVFPGDSVTSVDRTITIDTVAPGLPTITGPGVIVGPILEGATTDSTPTISGTGEPNATVAPRIDGVPASCVGGPPVVTPGGTWSCTPTNPLPLGSHNIATAQTDRATNFSGVSATQLKLAIVVPPVPVVVPPTPGPTATPTPTPTPKVPLVWSLTIDGDTFEPGDETDLSGSGLPAGSAVDAELHSTPVHVGSTVVGADGTFTLHVTIPLDIEPGPHQFVVTVTPPGEAAAPASRQVTVVAAQKAVSSPPEKTELVDAGGASDGAGATGTDRDDPGAPSSFTHAIESFQQIFSNPVVMGTAAAAGIALLLFVAFPAELLNSTLAEQYQRLQRRLPPVKVGWFARFRHWLDTTPLFGGILITFLAAFIFGFADPGFGFDITSARVVLACFIALFFVGYVASAVAGLIIRRRWQLPTVMELKPLGIILTVIGVVASRLLEFSPGFLIGLILGITLAGKSTTRDRAKAALVQTSVIFAFAILAWVGYSLLSGTVQSDTFGGALLFDTLVALTTEGLTAVFIGLLPFKYFEGAEIFANSKRIWIAAYVVSAFAFLAIVVPAANNWGDVGMSLPLWIGIVGAFFVVAIAVYLIFRFWVKDDEEEDEDEEPASVTSGNDRA